MTVKDIPREVSRRDRGLSNLDYVCIAEEFPEKVEKEKFKQFIIQLTHQLSLYDIHIIERILDDKYDQLLLAFTHKSFDPVNNWEKIEFLGDGLIRHVINLYLVENYSDAGEGIFTPTRFTLEEGRMLGVFAYRLGMHKFLRVNTKKMKSIDKGALLEDAFEAYIGIMTSILNEKYDHASSFLFCKRMIINIIQGMTISINWKDITSPITQLKEIGDDLNWGKEPLLQVSEVKSIDEKTGDTKVVFVVDAYGYPCGMDMGKIKIGTGKGYQIKLAKKIACNNAIHTLNNKYKIFHKKDTGSIGTSYNVAAEKKRNRPIQRTFKKERKDILSIKRDR